MRTRLTYVPTEIANQLDGFIVRREEELLDSVRAQVKGYSTFSLLKLLYQASGDPKSFSDLYASSNIRMKKSFISYLRLCVDYGLLERRAKGSHVYYEVTDNGRVLLGLFLQKGN